MRQLSEVELLRQANEARNAAVLSGLQRLLAGFAGWMQRRRAEAELLALTDRELSDIGLTRSDIPFVLAGQAPARGVEAPIAVATPAAANDRFRKHAAA
ncbi:DUF1127 domain-containing protein [Roseomonas sp. SG15]|uniref:DUF1127 domain-containing protein n=2 Tax=Roseomonas indoligenes TaxID=2820811 RepID=A0A940MSW6_9PROT|nr:DUF1127 domain-containing protein [Pararoseomonas indoligenes]